MRKNRLTTFVHPDQAYRLQYPEDWEHLEQDNGRSCGFGPRDRDDVGLWITILPFSLDAERLEADLPKLFAEAMADGESENIRRDATLRHFGLKADNTKEGEAGYFWMIIGGDLVLFASSQAPAAEREIWNPQFESLMAGLEITRDQDLLLRKTADDVFRRLRAMYPDQDYQLEADRILGRDHQISLVNVYKQVAASPERREQTVARFIDGLEFVAQHPPGQEELGEVRENILPVLKHVDYFKPGAATESLARTRWLNDVVICYAIREEKVSRLITDWDLRRWDIDKEAFHELAMENLKLLPWPERLEGSRESGGRLIILATNDNLEASRLLHPDLHRIFSGALGSPFYAGIPNIETLVAFSAGNDALFACVLRQIRQDHERSAYPITPELFLVTSRGVSVAKM